MHYNESTGSIIGGSFVRLIFSIEGSSNETITDIGEQFQVAYEEYLGSHSQDYLDSDNLVLTYYTDVSISGEFDRVVSNDRPILGAAFCVMLIVLSLILGKVDCIKSRAAMAFGSILSLIFSLICGFGLGSAFGYDFNTLVLLIPFILLGVGMDDQIVIVQMLDNTDINSMFRNNNNKEAEALKLKQLEEKLLLDCCKIDLNESEKLDRKYKFQDIRFGLAMKNAGLSIMLTSLSTVVAFLIGSNIDMPGITAFCIFSALAFLFNFS